MYMRAILPSTRRAFFRRSKPDANQFTGLKNTYAGTSSSHINAIPLLQKGGRCVFYHHTALSVATNQDVARYHLNNSPNSKNNNCKVKSRINVGGDANGQPKKYTMVRNLTMQTASSSILNLPLDTMSRKIIHSRKNTNQSNKDDHSKFAKPATADSDKESANQRDAYGIMSKQTADQISSILSQAKSIPNIITITRIFSTPFLSYLILTEQYKYALTGCVLAAISDGLDGYIARNYDGKTVLGTYLDPLADKLFINCLAITLSSIEVLPSWCVGVWIGKDVLLLVGSYRFVSQATVGSNHAVMDPARTPLKIETTFISQVNTALQFGTIGIGLGMASIDIPSDDVVRLLSMISCVTTCASGLSYIDGKSMTNSGNVGIKTKKDCKSKQPK